MKGRAETLAGVNMAALREARDAAAARGDNDFATDLHHAIAIRSRSQTPELEHCGQLFEHVEPPSRENGGRFITKYTGDISTWLGNFQQPGARCKLNKRPGVIARQTVDLYPGERVVVLQPGQRVV